MKKAFLLWFFLILGYCFGKDLVLAGYWEVPPAFNYNPWTVGGNTNLQFFVYSPLFYYFPEGEGRFIPCLGISFERKENEYIIHIRKNVKWTDGVELTSKDILVTFVIGALHGFYPPLQNVTIINSSKIKIEFSRKLLKSEEIRFLTMLINTPYHRYKYVVDEALTLLLNYKDVLIYRDYQVYSYLYPFEINFNKELIDKEKEYYNVKRSILKKVYMPYNDFVGNGMFVIEKVGFSEAVLIKNKLFFKDISLDRIRFIRWASNESLWASLVKGEIDFSHVATPYDLSQRVVKVNQNMRIITVSDFKEFGIVFNLRKKPMSDINFRKAISYLIDRDTVRRISNFYSTTTYFTTGMVYSVFKEKYFKDNDYYSLFSKEIPSFDVAKGLEILEKAGYKKRGNFYVDSTGKEIDLEILVEAGYTDWIVAAEIISSQLTKMGIKTKVRIVESALFNQLVLDGKFDICCRFVADNYTLQDAYRFLYSSGSFIYKATGMDNKVRGIDGKEYYLQDLVVKHIKGDRFASLNLAWITSKYLPFISIYEKNLVVFVNTRKISNEAYIYTSMASKGIENFYSFLIYQNMIK